MNSDEKRVLSRHAYEIRKGALTAIQSAKSGHLGGSFSIADILSVLYFKQMNIDIENPKKSDRDRLVLSKGHCSPALYSALALRGFFPTEHLTTFRTLDSDLSGHAEFHVPGVDMSSGSLGQGLSVALGMAMSAECKGDKYRVFCIMGDGEIQEGQVWEAAMAAGHFKADNLIAFVDNNNLQIDGPVDSVMSPYPIAEKFKAFGWNTIEIDGGNVEEINAAIDAASDNKGKPTVIVAKTIKGKGVSVFENQVRFHGGCPTDEEFETAFNELNEKIKELA